MSLRWHTPNPPSLRPVYHMGAKPGATGTTPGA